MTQQRQILVPHEATMYVPLCVLSTTEEGGSHGCVEPRYCYNTPKIPPWWYFSNSYHVGTYGLLLRGQYCAIFGTVHHLCSTPRWYQGWSLPCTVLQYVRMVHPEHSEYQFGTQEYRTEVCQSSLPDTQYLCLKSKCATPMYVQKCAEFLSIIAIMISGSTRYVIDDC